MLKKASNVVLASKKPSMDPRGYASDIFLVYGLAWDKARLGSPR
jgi:hypothetical protein